MPLAYMGVHTYDDAYVQGSAFPLVAEHFGFHHFLCTKHFLTNIPGATRGMQGGYADSFMKDASTAIYQRFHTVEELDAHIDSMKTKYTTEPALKYIGKLVQKKKQAP